MMPAKNMIMMKREFNSHIILAVFKEGLTERWHKTTNHYMRI